MTTMNSTTEAGSTDALLKLLAHPQRRTLLHYLRQNGAEPVPVNELVTVLKPDDVDPATDEGQRQRRQVLLSLQHVHLPQLADAGALDYDSRAETVHYTPVDRVEALLQFVRDELED